MIDFLKILIKDEVLVNRFKTDSRLFFHNRRERLSHFDFETIYAKETKQYKGILFCFFECKLEILFRPHYFFNANLHNANDFSMQDCISVLNEFINEFQIVSELDKFQIINLEFGINPISPVCVQDLITYAKYHQKNEFVNDDGLRFSKKSYRTNKNGTANQYKIIKLYAKSIQFPNYCALNTFRFEIKSKKSKYINSLGIRYLNDLLKPEIYQKLKSEIVNEFKQILILDNNHQYQNLNTRQKEKLKHYLNSDSWYKIVQNNIYRNKFSRAKKQYIDLLDKSGQNIHCELFDIVQKKLDFLTVKIGAVLPTFPEVKRGAYFPINIMRNCTY